MLRFVLILLYIIASAQSFAGVNNPGSTSPASQGDWSIGADGWTNFVARTGTGTCNATHSGTYTGTCKIYVATAGNDGTCTAIVATATPTAGQICATITKGATLLRDSSDDWLLLNKGDVWTNQVFASFNGGGSNLFCINGVSSAKPLLIGAYGTGARPLVKISSVNINGVFTTGGCPTGANFTAWVGIDFYSYDRDPTNPSYPAAPLVSTSGLFILTPIQWALIEDCKFSFFAAGIVIENAPSSNISLRRNIIVDQYDVSPNFGQGAFIALVSSLELYQNLFDHNGWNASIVGAEANTFSHNLYLAGYSSGAVPSNSTLTENIFANDGQGNQNRNGVIGTNNLHVKNAIVTAIGSPNVTGSLYNQNVILEGTDLPSAPSTHFGWGIDTMSSYEGDRYNLSSTTIQNNIIANTITTSGNGFGIRLVQGTNGVTVSSNIVCNWQASTPISFTGSPISIGNLISGSAYTNGNYGSPGVPTSYVTSGPGTGLAPFIAVTGGAVSTVNIYGNPSLGISSIMGSGYLVNDTLTSAAANIGGTGSGFSFQVTALGVNTIGTNTTKTADCNGLGFPAPTPGGGQTLTGNYNGTLGGTATTAGFLAAARLQSRDNWNPLLTAGAHNNYVRQTGFGLVAYPYNVSPFQ